MLMMMMSSTSTMLISNKMSKYYWHITSISIFLMAPMFLMKIGSTSMLNINPFCMIDNMSTTLMILTLWITALMFMASYKITINNQYSSLFHLTTLMLMLILLLCFSANSLTTFYIWFEASLIPTMMLIMLWGYQPERIPASMYLMIYTVTASLPLLMALCLIYTNSKSTMMSTSMLALPPSLNSHIGALLCTMAFMAKLPLFSVHLWLPKAHVEAPVAGSMVLAAILLKLGGYGLIRMTCMFSSTMSKLTPLYMSTAVIGAVLTSLMCLRQTDLKALIAYSSIGHMGIMIAGTLTMTSWGMTGAMMMMIAHGLCSSALFALANITYEMTHTRSLTLSKGMMASLPIMSMWWFLFMCANMAAPPTINLLSEIMLITASLATDIWMALPLMSLSFITACYSMIMYTSINHGQPLKNANTYTNMKMKDTSMLYIHLAPLLIVILKPELMLM